MHYKNTILPCEWTVSFFFVFGFAGFTCISHHRDLILSSVDAFNYIVMYRAENDFISPLSRELQLITLFESNSTPTSSCSIKCTCTSESQSRLARRWLLWGDEQVSTLDGSEGKWVVPIASAKLSVDDG